MTEEICKNNSRLQYFPITMFAITMGLAGLTLVYEKASHILGIPYAIGEGLLYITTLIFLMICLTYAIKFIKYKHEVLEEWRHPIRVNFFAAFSISLLILSMAHENFNPLLSKYMFYIGASVHFFLTLHTIKFWINHNQEKAHSNPAWFIPIVGNVLVPVSGVEYLNVNILGYFYSIGLFFWIILFAILLNRIIFHKQLATKFMPTLFIFIAPPAIAFISYVKVFGNVNDFFAIILFNLALFFSILVLFMYKNFIKIKFFISWWAFTFPIASMSLATMLLYSKTNDITLMYLSYLMVAITTTVIAIVFVVTIKNMIDKEVCIKE
jgi:tellurite resistance protein